MHCNAGRLVAFWLVVVAVVEVAVVADEAAAVVAVDVQLRMLRVWLSERVLMELRLLLKEHARGRDGLLGTGTLGKTSSSKDGGGGSDVGQWNVNLEGGGFDSASGT